ncbi:MAG: DoxX family protein [Proteobacteria bacterium]|nr:DoxX family protein [Pseudomonadota bacterium]
MDLTIIPASWAPRLLSVFRICCGLLLLQHGIAKFFKVPAVPMFANLDYSSMFGIAGFFELIGGALLVIGLFTRPTAFILSGMTAVAYFYAHAPRSFFPLLNGGETVILFSFGLLYVAAAGPGPWSIDATRSRESP